MKTERENSAEFYPTLDYQEHLEQILSNLSKREKQLMRPLPELTRAEAEQIKAELKKRNFVRCPAGRVLLGRSQGLPCKIEGFRENETPPRIYHLASFYICRTTVTNLEFEQFDPRHTRPLTSPGDNHPVTCVTYGRAISYILWLNQQTGLQFCLPTEPQLIKAIAPFGWEYPYQKTGKPRRREQNVYRSFPERYPRGLATAALEVNDPSIPPNYLGLYHATGNVSVFTFGHYIAQPGHWGAKIDGAYTIVVGGNFRLCPYGGRVVTRGIIDVTGLADTIGIRLVHPDPDNYVKE